MTLQRVLKDAGFHSKMVKKVNISMRKILEIALSLQGSILGGIWTIGDILSFRINQTYFLSRVESCANGLAMMKVSLLIT